MPNDTNKTENLKVTVVEYNHGTGNMKVRKENKTEITFFAQEFFGGMGNPYPKREQTIHIQMDSRGKVTEAWHTK